MAFLALFWIIIWIIWTGVLMLFSGNNWNSEQKISAEQLHEIQKMINSQSWKTTKNKIETLTWKTNN